MDVIFFILRFAHYSMCFSLILTVLLQAGKSGGMAGIFSGSGSNQIFSTPSRAAFIKKLTVVMACIFLITSLTLTKFSVKVGLRSAVDQLAHIPR